MCVLSKPLSPSEVSSPHHKNKIAKEKVTTPKKAPAPKVEIQVAPKEKVTIEFDARATECAICYTTTDIDNRFTTQCNHSFCNGCITKWLLAKDDCPMCRATLCPSAETESDDEDDDNTYDITVVMPPGEVLPENIIRTGVLQSLNLIDFLTQDDFLENDNSLITNWNIQPAPPLQGWRSNIMVYGTIIRDNHIQYGVYVDTRDANQYSNIEYLISSIIRHVNIYIIPIDRFFSHRTRLLMAAPNIKVSKRAMKQQRYFVNHKNTARSAKRYNHRR